MELHRQEKEWGYELDCQPLQLRMLLPMIGAPELLLLDACIQAPVLYIDATMFKKSAVGVVVVVAVLVEV